MDTPPNPKNNNVNGNIPKKRRWYRRQPKNSNIHDDNDNNVNNIPPPPPPPPDVTCQTNETTKSHKRQKTAISNPPISSTPRKLTAEEERILNQEHVAKMEQQLHTYFQTSKTPYTYINDSGIFKYSAPPPQPQAQPTSGFLLPFTSSYPTFPTNAAIPVPYIPTPTPAPTPAPTPKPAKVPVPPPPPPPPQLPVIEEITICEEISHIRDLIALCDKYPLSETKKYNINMKAIHAIRVPLEDLSDMVGMESLKRNIVDQILYFVQNLHIRPDSPQSDSSNDKSGKPVSATTTNPNELLNPFAAAFVPPIYNENVAPSMFQFKNPFLNLAPVFDFSAINNKIAENNKKKGESLFGGDFSAPTSGDFMHTVLYGPPGSGKTEVAKIIGRIFSGLGILSKNTFKKVSRHDLVAGYLGQTAMKTKDVIKASLGGVLFIDEAYSLGNSEKRDSFAKECIDTLCEALSEHKGNWMVIIAGYEKELNDCFFNFNEGLNSRFTWRFKLEEYSAREMKEIFEKKIKCYNWTIANGETFPESWFETRMVYFTTYGRDMETLFTKTKIAHSRRVFCLPLDSKTKITMKDLENGFLLFTDNQEVKDRKERNGMGNYMKSLYL